MTFEGRSIAVTLGGRTILSDVDFTARAGGITAIVGPNGSGKTTLLRALCAELPHGGRMRINGRDVTAHSASELASIRAVLPQSVTLAFPFAVSEIVQLGQVARAATPRADLPGRVLAAVGLVGYGARMYQDLSGGEQQRVQLARVLLQVWEPVVDGAPRWLLLDEPVASLDIGHQLMVMRLAQDYGARGGGVIAVMHDLNLTAMFASHVVLMRRGRVAAAGAVPRVFTDATLSAAYGPALRVNSAPPDGTHFVLPHSAA
ncbi:heme ABC transporter ATP-binding protein [Sedimentitalea todarodis]|uniref:Heme ABC transporter ATP-binding protein n=1 Tax=Sedimentitalea todarodis TaxID=1631240 RepID=A0ABU3VA49_9RHOB|nr:heme ABC transporter ATP-binding protein [Sedimentitalea todarodis]MDU9002905.1 heme ABC transporter ATP-binding protein [Sedimentitalea todarodis]